MIQLECCVGTSESVFSVISYPERKFLLYRIDFLAPKAGQNDWFLKFVPTLDAAYPDMNITSYPGLAFAKALVLRNMEEEKKEVSEREVASFSLRY